MNDGSKSQMAENKIEISFRCFLWLHEADRHEGIYLYPMLLFSERWTSTAQVNGAFLCQEVPENK